MRRLDALKPMGRIVDGAYVRLDEAAVPGALFSSPQGRRPQDAVLAAQAPELPDEVLQLCAEDGVEDSFSLSSS